MAIPARQALRVASYVIKHKLKGTKHYPLVLMLEPPSAASWPAPDAASAVSAPHPQEAAHGRKSASTPWMSATRPSSAFPAASRSCIPISLKSSKASWRKSVCLSLHQCAGVGAQVPRVQALHLLQLRRAPGWIARSPRLCRSAARAPMTLPSRASRRPCRGLPGHHQHHLCSMGRSQSMRRSLTR